MQSITKSIKLATPVALKVNPTVHTAYSRKLFIHFIDVHCSLGKVKYMEPALVGRLYNGLVFSREESRYI